MLRPSDVLGRLLAGVISLLTRVRRRAKPMHPRGAVVGARLEPRPAVDAVAGAAFLDRPPAGPALVRVSRSAGLPEGWPDVNGLAVRLPGSGAAPVDLLLSGAGSSWLGRYLLAPRLRSGRGFLSCLVPYRSTTGPVHVGARPRGERAYELVWARPGVGWVPFADLVLDRPTTAEDADEDVSFDAVRHEPEGLDTYGWFARLRAPSYAVARRVRGAELVAGEDPARRPGARTSRGWSGKR